MRLDAIAPIVFTPVNSNVAQTVTVTATDDTVVEGSHTGTIDHSVAAGSAAEYLPVAIAPVSVKDSDSLVGGAGDDVLIGDEGSDTLLGGSGRDLFLLTPAQGSDIVSDFRKGEDLLSLADGLTFAQLSISQSTDGQNASPATLIRIANSGEILAVLNGVQASTIAPSDFVQILRIGS